MGLRIVDTVPSIFARQEAGNAANRLEATQRQLSSLLRINRAADDAAGLAIAEGFRTQIRQFNQEVGSLQSGANLLATAEGGLEIQGSAIGRIRELAVQASNGTLSADQRAALNAEAQQLLGEIDSVAANTEFNGTAPLSADTTVTLTPDGADEVTVQESTTSSLGLDTLDISTQGGAQAALGALDAAAQQVNSNRANIGAQGNRIASSIEQREIASENALAAESAIRDLDVARAFIERTRNEVLLQSGISAILQGNVSSESAQVLLGG